MKIIFYFLIMMLGLTHLIILPTGAQYEKPLDMLYAQTIVRNSEGILVTYLETSKIDIIDMNIIRKIINDNSTKIISIETIERNDKVQEIITFEPKQLTYDTEGTRGINILGIMVNERIVGGALFQNDGYFLESDDHLSVIWTVSKTL